MPEVFIAAGSNIRPAENLRLACSALAGEYGRLVCSRVYRSAAVGFDGGEFLNLVIGLRSEDAPEQIGAVLDHIEARAGRRRAAERFASRTLDLDLLLYGDLVDSSPTVRVPREDILEYGFVLRPLAEIAPDFVHPVSGRTILREWRDFDPGRHSLRVEKLEL